LLNKPHLDKEGLEYLLLRASVAHPAPEAHLPPEDILPREAIPSVKENFLPEVIIVRPAMFTGNQPPKGKDKTQAGETIAVYRITRPEVARFIAEECVPGEDEWLNKLPVVGY
jgi:hypothetical protein